MGHNGSGKTTILEALTFALTGKEPDNTKRAEWANSTIDPPFEASISLSLQDQQAKIHQIVRTFNYNRSKSGDVQCSAGKN